MSLVKLARGLWYRLFWKNSYIDRLHDVIDRQEDIITTLNGDKAAMVELIAHLNEERMADVDFEEIG
jgi:hypothetical protein